MRWKYNVQIDNSLAQCLGSTITIDKSEKCMADLQEQYQYQLSDDHKYYKIKKKLAIQGLDKDYYVYKHNYTNEEITNFLCNNNMKVQFISTPYQGSFKKGTHVY